MKRSKILIRTGAILLAAVGAGLLLLLAVGRGARCVRTAETSRRPYSWGVLGCS